MFNDTPSAGIPAGFCHDAHAATCASPAGCRLETLGKDEPGRQSAEEFVARGFLRSHRACIRSFLPSLVALRDASGVVQGVVGCRRADEEPLFLERYLDSPVEAILASRWGIAASRAQIVEVGNFACRSGAAARKLVSLLPRYLVDQGALWITFTATRAVRGLIRESGARPLELAAATPDRAAGTADEWGGYYATDPRVMAGYLPLARGFPALWKSLDDV